MKVGDIITIKKQVKWHECQECGLPASFRITFLFGGNSRGNPASQAFGMDDCSRCSDAEVYSCKKHTRAVESDAPNGMKWCATFPLKKYKHMGFYLVEVKDEGIFRNSPARNNIY